MFNLYAGIDFDEIEVLFILVYQEFHGACIEVVYMLHELYSRIADLLAEFHRQGPGRSHFDNLLVAALDGAVTFEEMNHIALFIADNLYFNMLRVHDAFLYIYILVAESHLRFRFSPVISLFQILHAVHIADAAAAAAVHCFDHNGEAVLFSEFLHFLKALHRPFGSGNHGDIRFFSLDTGIDLVAEHHQMFHPGADENNAFLFTALCQLRIFSQEAVARMDGIHIMLLADTDNVFNVQISINRLVPFPYQVRFISPVSMQGQNIFLGINGHSTDSQFAAGTEYADGDFASVGNQDLTNMSHTILSFKIDFRRNRKAVLRKALQS